MAPWLAVAIGGAVGSVLRYSLDLIWPSNFGLATLVINVIGSFTIGVLVTGVFTRKTLPHWLPAALGPGLLGGFTTMSGFAQWMTSYILIGNMAIILAYLLGSVVLGLAAAWAGLALGRLIHREGAVEPDIDSPDWPEDA